MPAPASAATADLSFPLKLYAIMEQEPRVFKWNAEHPSFRIIDEDALTDRILQQHFRTSRFSSFTRNLNIYGFKKIAKGEFAGSYCHPDFRQGDRAAASLMRRCVKKVADAEPSVKQEPCPAATGRKPGPHSAAGQASQRTKPAAAPQQPQPQPQQRPVAVKVEPAAETVLMERPPRFADDGGRLSTGSLDGSGFWNGSLGEDDFSMEHELALPPSHDDLVEDGEEYPNFYAGAPAACCSTLRDLFHNPLAEDDDLSEWKKVLCFTSNNCPAFENAAPQPQPQPCPPSNKGANAYCVQVPAGPLGATLECQGDKVFLSQVTDRRSPLAHIPVGAQLVNLDGKDTTQMAASQISRLDESTCHRNRMVIFTLAQCWDTALLAMTPELPQRNCDWGPPKAKSMHHDADVDMDTDSCSDASPHPGSPSCNSGWLQCLYETM